MQYKKISIDTTTSACESVSYFLGEMGITCIEIEDKIPVDDEIQGGTFEELQPDMEEDDGTCKVNFYLEEYSEDLSDYAKDILGDIKNIEDYNFALQDLLNKMKLELEDLQTYMDAGSCQITFDTTKDEDWQNNWKEFFKAFEIGDLLIRPTWDDETQVKEGQILVEIDPGISFGTGKHETTQLCITGLQKHMSAEDKVLDLGFGSAILSIVALKMGASHVVGTDIDPDCIIAAKENFQVNNLSQDLANFYIGNLTSDMDLQDKVGYGQYDIVVANILADIIVGMAPVIPQTMKSGGILITSGIIDFKEEEVVEALKEQGLEIIEINHLGEWVNVTAKKN